MDNTLIPYFHGVLTGVALALALVRRRSHRHRTVAQRHPNSDQRPLSKGYSGQSSRGPIAGPPGYTLSNVPVPTPPLPRRLPDPPPYPHTDPS